MSGPGKSRTQLKWEARRERWAIKKALWEKSKGRCHYCKRYMLKDADKTFSLRFTIDHVIPKSAGGTTDLDNCVAACLRCNRQKRDIIIPKKGE